MLGDCECLFFVIHVTFRARLRMLFSIIFYILTRKEKKPMSYLFNINLEGSK
jgi:hypothetical protein